MSDTTEHAEKLMAMGNAVYKMAYEAARQAGDFTPSDLPNIFVAAILLCMKNCMPIAPKETEILAYNTVAGLVSSLKLNNINIDIETPKIEINERTKNFLFIPINERN